jgi:hypothetical protein
MTNILKAIKRIVDNPIPDLVSYYKGKNRINSVSDTLDYFVKDIFANSINESEEYKKLEKYNDVFAYMGNPNNPPDLILKDGDSIIIRQVESLSSEIILTGSYPRYKLLADDSAISPHCCNCESWSVKDLIYIIGVAENNQIAELWLIYGDCYFADIRVYENLLNVTDPLQVTRFNNSSKCRIALPKDTFNYLSGLRYSHRFAVNCILRKDKYYSFTSSDRKNLEELTLNKKLLIKNVEIKNPNNPENTISAKLISFVND